VIGIVFKDQEQSPLKRQLFGVFPLFIFFTFTVGISCYFFSSYLVLSPRYALEEWSCNGEVTSEKVWNRELNNLLFAQKFSPWNADIAMDLGRMYEWKALSGAAWNSNSREARTNASYHFEQAIKYRPTWALALVSFAQSQLLNREINEEVFLALSNGFTYGRWQTDVQEKLLWLSIGLWKKLPDDLKQQVRDQIVFTLERENSIQMLTRLAIRFHWFDELIPLVSKSEDIEYLELVRESPERMRQALAGTGGAKQEEYVCRVASI